MDLGFIRAAPGPPMEARFPCQQGNLQTEGPALAEAKSWWRGVPELGGQQRQPSLGHGDLVFYPPAWGDMSEGGPIWCHLLHLSFLLSDFTSAQPLASASHLPDPPWECHLCWCWWGPGTAIFILCRPGCPGSIMAQKARGAVQQRRSDRGGKGGSTAGCQASGEGSFLSRLLPGSPRVNAVLTLCHSGFLRPHLVLRASSLKTQMGRGALGQVAPAWPAAHTRGLGRGWLGFENHSQV